MDVFLPASVARTAGLPHDAFNRRYACTCVARTPARPAALSERSHALATRKLQYVSFTRPFEARSPAVISSSSPRLPRPILEMAADALDAVATDWGGAMRRTPRAVLRPSSTDALSEALAWASRERRRVAIRGAGFSFAGEALGDDVVLVTTALDGVRDHRDESITIGGGATFEALVRAAWERRRAPPVLSGWPAATVGGVLSAAGFGKGSHRHGWLADHVLSLEVVTGEGRRVTCSRKQAGWLFDAVLGGRGAYGVIAEATLRLVDVPPVLRVERVPLEDAQPLGRALDDVGPFHVTAFAGASGPFTVVHAYGAADGVPFLAYALPPRVLAPPVAGARVLQLAVSPTSLAPVLDAVRERMDVADALQVHPLRSARSGAAGSLHVVGITRPGLADLETIAIAAAARGARRLDDLLAGREAHLGDRPRTLHAADPAGIFTR